MGLQTYAIPFDNDEQLDAVLDVLKAHNADYGGGFTNEFVRYNDGEYFKQLEVGEKLTDAKLVTFKAGKSFKTPRNGPSLSRAVLVSNDGGNNETFSYLMWQIRFACPNVYVDGFEAIVPYECDDCMDKRFIKNATVSVSNMRIGGFYEQVSDEQREADRVASFEPRPAKYTTRISSANPAYRELLKGLNGKDTKKRIREERDVQPYTKSYTTFVEGWVVEGRHFPTKDEGMEYAVEVARISTEPVELDANHARFLRMREAGKAYWKRAEGGIFWLTVEELAERRASGESFSLAVIEYSEDCQGDDEAWMNASVEEVEEMFATGKKITLHNC